MALLGAVIYANRTPKTEEEIEAKRIEKEALRLLSVNGYCEDRQSCVTLYERLQEGDVALGGPLVDPKVQRKAKRERRRLEDEERLAAMKRKTLGKYERKHPKE